MEISILYFFLKKLWVLGVVKIIDNFCIDKGSCRKNELAYDKYIMRILGKASLGSLFTVSRAVQTSEKQNGGHASSRGPRFG